MLVLIEPNSLHRQLVLLAMSCKKLSYIHSQDSADKNRKEEIFSLLIHVSLKNPPKNAQENFAELVLKGRHMITRRVSEG